MDSFTRLHQTTKHQFFISAGKPLEHIWCKLQSVLQTHRALFYLSKSVIVVGLKTWTQNLHLWIKYPRNTLNFFKSDTQLHLDLSINWLDFSCQRSKTVNSNISVKVWGNFFQFVTNIHLVVCGHCDSLNKYYIPNMLILTILHTAMTVLIVQIVCSDELKMCVKIPCLQFYSFFAEKNLYLKQCSTALILSFMWLHHVAKFWPRVWEGSYVNCNFTGVLL